MCKETSSRFLSISCRELTVLEIPFWNIAHGDTHVRYWHSFRKKKLILLLAAAGCTKYPLWLKCANGNLFGISVLYKNYVFIFYFARDIASPYYCEGHYMEYTVFLIY